MNIFDKFFSKPQKVNKEPEDSLKLAKAIGPIIDKLANDIFLFYSRQLAIKPANYIIPAVWGDEKNGELDHFQKAISKQVLIVVDNIFNLLAIDNLGKSQAFAIEFLIKGLIITKIIYMIEVLRNRMDDEIEINQEKPTSLEDLEPIGRA